MQRGDKLITDKKITEADYTNKDVTSAPDRLTGTAQENKYVFDRAVKEVVQPKYNALIDELDTELGKRIQSDDILKMRLDENGVVEYSANGTTYTRMIGRPGVKEDGTPATGAEIFNNHPGNEASGSYSHAEGKGANATGVSSHAEGDSTTASGKSSHAEGTSTNASGEHSHAEGYGASAEGQYSHAEGLSTTSSGKQSHAEGCFSEATGDNSHAQGRETVASGMYSHAQGYHTTAAGDGSHAEGYRATNGKSIAYGKGSHIEGIDTVAGSYYSNGLDIAAHAEGKDTIASSIAAHSEGNGTAARGIGSHAEGGGTAATGSSAHAEGNETTASGDRSHAEGWKTTASGEVSHAGGYYTIASADYQFAIGKYNKESTDAAVIVGNGTSTTARSNALELDWEGNLKLAGDVTFAGNRLLSDELANLTLPVAGDALGGVKNGGNVTINEDGTMTAPEGGGDVSSVNGKTGAVTLTAADVGALSKTVQTVTDWNDASTGLYQSGGDAANAPDSASGSSSEECRGLIIDKAQFVMRNNYFNRDSWAGFRYYMGGGTFSEWFPFTASAAGLTAATIADWNTAYKTGFYYARNASNAPASNAHIFAWVISAESAYSGVQLAWKFGSPTALYARSFTVRDWDLEEFYFDTWELLLGGTTTLE